MTTKGVEQTGSEIGHTFRFTRERRDILLIRCFRLSLSLSFHVLCFSRKKVGSVRASLLARVDVQVTRFWRRRLVGWW